ncbi:MAG: citrate/2-methylcitrate synthase [Nitrososphaerales archaeon]|nr:citrate/2-methylcitrate synthase [Nitrososphaerales archaeon]HJN57706.1 citrate/2-methylcitrate synthase [Nitrososphaerales archaeon]
MTETKVDNNGQINTKNIGLRGIHVADTMISGVDGENGKLEYRGYSITDLAKYSSFEETAYLLLYGDLPNQKQIEEFKAELANERDIPDLVVQTLKSRSPSALSMDVLQSAISLLADYDPDLESEDKDAHRRKGIRLISKVATVIAAWDRIRNGLEYIKPNKTLSHSANFLYMINGEKPTEEIAKYIDIAFILHADHSFNASTFVARGVASTRAHMYAAVTAAIGTLSGILHGGANTRVMKELIEIGEPDQVENWVKSRLNKGGLVMGMGHAQYKTNDPRAIILKGISEKLGTITNEPKWYEMTQMIEEITKKEFLKLKKRNIHPNVDLYSASVYYMAGIDTEIFTSLFAVQRMVGWVAHIIEEKFAEAQPKAVLYRPSSTYIGRSCGDESCKYEPIEKRK